jgi:hypothetical protein
MELHITRSQAGDPQRQQQIQFTTRYHLVLTPEERANYDRYGLPDQMRQLGSGADVEALIDGTYEKSTSALDAAAQHEQTIRQLCAGAAKYLREAAAYQGTETLAVDENWLVG